MARGARAREHFDTSRAGFEAHRAWEATAQSGGWGMVSWAVEYGGRRLDLIRWQIFEEEYCLAGAPGRVNQNGIFLLEPTLIEFVKNEQKQRFPGVGADDGTRTRTLKEKQIFVPLRLSPPSCDVRGLDCPFTMARRL